MSVRAQILSFLRDADAFRRTAADPEAWLAGLDECAIPMLAASGGHPLRPAQVAAWRGMAGERAALVLGPPGTGKTHVLAWIILGYVEARRARGLPTRVFVSAFTRNAIGNLLDAVAGLAARHARGAVDAHYLGSAPPAGLSRHVAHRERLSGADGRAALDDLRGDAVVAGASVWALHRLMELPEAAGDSLTAELFDLVCIDEASQLVLGHGLMAMAGLAPDGRVVVAGDDRQLPPIRAGREVRIGGLEIGGSLYGFMKSAAFAEFPLDETFRLNGPLAAFPERMFYSGRYRSAVDGRRLALDPDWRRGLLPWQEAVLDPEWPVVILLHEGRSAATSNPFEANLAADLCALLAGRLAGPRTDAGVTEGLWQDRLAAISLHRAQNRLIRNALPPALREDAFIETVDRIQGKERDAVILSYCVADPEFAVAEAGFIFSPERLNVAVTRARSKLVMIVSRRLLDAAPSDQEHMDDAEVLREFVFAAAPASTFVLRDEGRPVGVRVRVGGFAGGVPLPEAFAGADAEPVAQPAGRPAQAADLGHLEAAVRACALASRYGTATVAEVGRRLARRDGIVEGLSRLQADGRIRMEEPQGPSGPFLVARPLDPPEAPYGVDGATVVQRMEEVIRQSHSGTLPPFYAAVRQRFAWMGADGLDALRPHLDRLAASGDVALGTANGSLTVDWRDRDEAVAADVPADAPAPSEADFVVLNALEDMEAARINFGVFEAWTSAASIADRNGLPRERVAGALGRLAADGWLMLAAEGRVRSRMAELAREVRYLKQRFRREDAADRPYLVRSLKLVLRDRDKPGQTEPLDASFQEAGDGLPDQAREALAGLRGALGELWGPDARLAGFQARSLRELMRGWHVEEAGSFVIAADTGSGKTEAAGLPLIAAAAADRLAGIAGVRAVLAYPRVRLATNQAQRFARYLAALARQPGMPTLTLGLQVAAVPRRFEALDAREAAAGWASLGHGRFAFPFFGCPACAADLMLLEGGGSDGADRLDCTGCGWAFSGWIGSKAKLMSHPPAIFVPTTDSLHKWMHDDRYGRLFGDDAAYAPPRALLADEIHLYSHIHGAQVGMTLRRLAGRAEANGRAMVMIGMSATLGDPQQAWSRLSGRPCAPVLGPLPAERVPRPKGREYFFFVQPEVESRGKDIAGASTTIQTLMCLTHGTRRRTGKAGGFRTLAFLDSIEKVRRVHAAYHDAEGVLRLASYRTRLYPPDPATGAPREGCCGEPHGCDAFRDGECWYFAATDAAQRSAAGRKRPGAPLSVADQPVSSETSGRVEALIKGSDVIFATSSLEVGYDDPDITMVYQHYAPQNHASFIQRKGRGGRDAEDRPVTGVTLSLYSSRDSFWFRRPEEMVAPSDFDAPLNPDNHFVRRGQILATVLDALARHQRRSGTRVDPARPPPHAWREAKDLLARTFGLDCWRDYGHAGLEGMWASALARAPQPAPRLLGKVRDAVDWIPGALFEAVNLPRVMVAAPGLDARAEDVSLALAGAAPGNASRRFSPVDVYWRPPVGGMAPWFAEGDYGQRDGKGWHRPFGDDAGEWLARLPDAARPALAGLSPSYFRPSTVTLEALGRAHGVGWQSDWVVMDPAHPAVAPLAGADHPNRRVRHESSGSLRGFPVVKANGALSVAVATSLPLPLVQRIERFAAATAGSRETGLALAKVYWGADANVRIGDQRTEDVSFAQTFCVPGTRQPLLHGYHVQTEGVRIVLDRGRLAAFVAAEVARLEDDGPWRKWHAGQMLRFVLESKAQALGVSSYDTQRAAELMVGAAALPDLRGELSHLLTFWDGGRLAALFEQARARLLSQHPLLSHDRVARVAERLSAQAFQELFEEATRSVGQPADFSRYIESKVLHALAVRLKEAFVQIGRGDERQVAMHVRLPIQFSDPGPAEVTICEAGAYGDGTTRSFLKRIDAFAERWRDGFLSDCPNARDDAALDRLFAQPGRHDAWRSIDPNDPAALAALATELGHDVNVPLPSAVLRTLFGSETVGNERFHLFDVARALRDLDATTGAALGRPLSAWEHASVAVEDARARPTSVTGRLLGAYAAIEDATLQESLSPEARLADQAFRLNARLCVDGCRACVHQGSDMMTDSMVEASTSRTLLARFVASA